MVVINTYQSYHQIELLVPGCKKPGGFDLLNALRMFRVRMQVSDSDRIRFDTEKTRKMSGKLVQNVDFFENYVLGTNQKTIPHIVYKTYLYLFTKFLQLDFIS